MKCALINKKTVRTSKEMKMAQKIAKKYYGRVRGRAPKAKIGKVVDITDISFVDMTQKNSIKQVDNKFTMEEVINVCESHQLLGRSGNGYPVADKLKAFANYQGANKIIIINGVECDPGLVQDAWLYRNEFDKMLQGIEILQQSFHIEQSYLATREPISHETSKVIQVRVPNRFPCGYEKEVVKFVIGMELGENEYPIHKGVLVMNLQTVIMIAELLHEDVTANSRYLTAANLLTGKAVVVKASIEKNAEDIVKTVFPQDANSKIFIGGGVLNCHPLENGEHIDQTTNLIAIGQMPKYEEAGHCKGCGACSRNCPQGIKVHKLVQAMEKGNVQAAKAFGAEKCIGCGACTYGCMAGKDVRAFVAKAKNA